MMNDNVEVKASDEVNLAEVVVNTGGCDGKDRNKLKAVQKL